MAQLKSDVAIARANQALAIAQQIRNLRDQVAAFLVPNQSGPYGTLWAGLHTTALNSDGTLGAADAGTPVATNAIDPRVYPSITRAVTPADLTNALQLATDFQTFSQGSLLAAQAARPAFIDNVASV